jgi:prevent-host-death family protein
MKTELVTTLKRRATELIAGLAESRDPILITQHGRPAAYLVDVETYEALGQRVAILEAVARGERAIQDGRTFSQQQAKKRMSRWFK